MIDYLFTLLLGQKFVRDILQVAGIYSEKRVQRFFITAILLLLTIADAIYNRYMKPEILGLWLASAVFEGWRITKEKQLFKTKSQNEYSDKEQGNDSK